MRLELHRLTASYGSNVVLRDASLVVPDGTVAAVLGPNGAGKTTLLSTISGIVPPTAGSVTLDGEDIVGLGPHERSRRGVCHVTEGRSVFPALDIRDNLRMFAPAGSKADAIEIASEAFPWIRDRLSQRAGTLSGGQAQMLALARAYVSEAPVVLLDEVSMGLAPRIVDEIFESLDTLARDGRSLLIVEQYAHKALQLAQLVYVLVRGRIVFAGEPDELVGTDIFEHYLGAV